MKKVIISIGIFSICLLIYAKTGYEYYNNAYDLYLVHDYKGALKELKNAIKLLPEFEKAYNLAGLCLLVRRIHLWLLLPVSSLPDFQS